MPSFFVSILSRADEERRTSEIQYHEQKRKASSEPKEVHATMLDEQLNSIKWNEEWKITKEDLEKNGIKKPERKTQAS